MPSGPRIFLEGKMSNTLKDERFKENAAKAELKACRSWWG